MLNYATVGFLGLQALGLVLFLLDKGLQDDVLVNIAAACDGTSKDKTSLYFILINVNRVTAS